MASNEKPTTEGGYPTLTKEEIEKTVPVFRQLFDGYLLTLVLNLTCKLGVPDIIGNAGKPLTAEEIIEKTGKIVNINLLRRMLRFLSAHGIYKEVADQNDIDPHFTLTNLSNLARKDSLPEIYSYYSFEEMWNGALSLGDCLMLKEDKSPIDISKHFEHMRGETEGHSHEHHHNKEGELHDIHEHQNVNQETEILIRYLEETLDELGKKGAHILDLGGGDGGNVALLKKKFPGLKCTCFDKPNIIQGIKEKPEGVDFVEGDFFAPGAIPKADVILLKHILHGWEDANCIKILQSSASALPVGGLVITAEIILPNVGMIDPESIACKLTFNTDMLMKIFGIGGRSEKEYRQLFQTAGLQITDVLNTPEVFAQIIISKKF